MALKSVVTDINTVPESLRGEYTQQGDQFILNIDEFDSHPSVQGLKSAHQKNVAALKEMRDKYKDVDPVKYAEFQQQLKEAEEKAHANDPEKLKAKLKADFDRQISEITGQRDTYRGRFRDVALRDRAKAIALSSGVNPEDLNDVITLTLPRLDLDEETMGIKVKDADGTDSVDTVEKFFGETWKKGHEKFYRADRGEGGGAGGSGGARSTASTIVISPEDAKDVAKYRRAREQAQKEGKQLVIG